MAEAFPAIVSTGGFQPETHMSTAHIAEIYGYSRSPTAIARGIGVESRAIAGPDMLTSTMGAAAATEALDMAGIESPDILIVATEMPDYPTPSTATIIHEAIGAGRRCSADDVSAACSGFVYALQLGTQELMADPSQDSALLIGAAMMSRTIDGTDLPTTMIFADGAGAVVVERVEGADAPVFAHRTHPSDALMVPGRGMANPDGSHILVMRGDEVLRTVAPMMVEAAQEAGTKAELYTPEDGFDWDQIDLVVPHPGSKVILHAVARGLEVPKEKVLEKLATHGNTSAASIPLAINAALLDPSDERVVAGEPIRTLVVAGGAGFEAKAGIMTMQLRDPAAA